MDAMLSRRAMNRREMLKHTDQRVKLMNQLLVGVRVLKMYAWESAQEAAVSDFFIESGHVLLDCGWAAWARVHLPAPLPAAVLAVRRL